MYTGTQFRYATNYRLSLKELFAFYYLVLFPPFLPRFDLLQPTEFRKIWGRETKNAEFEKQLNRFKHTLELCLSTVLSKSKARFVFFSPSSCRLSHTVLQAEFNFCEMLQLSVGVGGCSEDRQL